VDAELGRSAEQLVPAAQTYVLTILPALSEDHPDVYDVVGADLLPYWDFLATVACVGVAFIAIPTAVAKPEQQDLICNVIQDCMETWNPSSHGAFENFLGHHTMFVKQGLTPPDAVGLGCGGMWRNTLRQTPRRRRRTSLLDSRGPQDGSSSIPSRHGGNEHESVMAKGEKP
jgi:hypothetical protein